jgi:hypothetical protein
MTKGILINMKKILEGRTKGERLRELDKIIKKYREEFQQNRSIIIIKKEV